MNYKYCAMRDLAHSRESMLTQDQASKIKYVEHK